MELLEILDQMRASRCIPNQVRGAGYREVRDKGDFVKLIFGFNESHVKLSHQLKIHVRGAM